MSLRFTPEGNVTPADIGDDEVLVVYAEDRPCGIDGRYYILPAGVTSAHSLQPYVEAFLDLAGEWDETTFVVTRPAAPTPLADADIAPLFDRALDLYNVVLPEAYVKIILDRRIRSGRPLPAGIE